MTSSVLLRGWQPSQQRLQSFLQKLTPEKARNRLTAPTDLPGLILMRTVETQLYFANMLLGRKGSRKASEQSVDIISQGIAQLPKNSFHPLHRLTGMTYSINHHSIDHHGRATQTLKKGTMLRAVAS